MTDAPGKVPLPVGFRIELDPDVRVMDGGLMLLGGRPRRALRLSARGLAALAEIRSGPVRSPAGGRLARRLLTAGIAHPRPPDGAVTARVPVIVPVRDRAAELDRCLGALAGHDVLVVDDESDDLVAVGSVTARHGARLVARPVAGGPAAARNTGLRESGESGLIAFLDSDCEAPPGWLEALVPHFADPAVGAVAPRLRPSVPGGSRTLSEYAAVRSPLDMGPREARVAPGTPVPYVPTAALVVRRSALPGFDEALRYGEDVDAVWRMLDSGWEVRYDPSTTVAHTEPADWPSLLRRRYRYGTSAGPLARRHPGRLAPMVIQPLPAAVTALLLARRPGMAAAAASATVALSAGRLRRAGAPATLAPPVLVQAVGSTVLGVGTVTAQLALPAAVAAVAARPRRRAVRLALLAGLVAAPALRDWVRSRPRLDPLRWTLASLADDMAYGAGVWRGAVAARTAAPLRPRWAGWRGGR